MKAIILPDYTPNVLRALLSLKVEQIDIPELKSDEVLVDLHAATCNPSDIAFILGGYNIIKTLPTIPGFEASGSIFKTGKNVKELLGKKVSCFVQSDGSGTWAEQFVVNKNDLILLKEDFNLDQAATFSVNPLTAYGLIETAKEQKSKAIIQNAAGGQVAEFIRKLAEINDIEVINIFRKPKAAELCASKGEKYVLSELDECFTDKLEELAFKLSATTAFDAVGGSLSGKLFNSMPDNAQLILYGGLSGKRMEDINEMDLIFKNKSISGFNLIDWKENITKEEFLAISEKLQDMFISGFLTTKIQGTTTLDNILGGLKSYLKNMSDGKLLIKP